jgi:hypothetical protein
MSEAPQDFPVVIYHNPDCGTSRNALAMIRAAGYEPQVIAHPILVDRPIVVTPKGVKLCRSLIVVGRMGQASRPRQGSLFALAVVIAAAAIDQRRRAVVGGAIDDRRRVIIAAVPAAKTTAPAAKTAASVFAAAAMAAPAAAVTAAAMTAAATAAAMATAAAAAMATATAATVTAAAAMLCLGEVEGRQHGQGDEGSCGNAQCRRAQGRAALCDVGHQDLL